METNKSAYIGYEYRTITVKKESEGLWQDSMANLGWQLEKREAFVLKPIWGPARVMVAPLALIPGTPFSKMVRSHNSETEINLHFKRDKNIANKAELNRLQSEFEASMQSIGNLEKSKTSSASIAAYTIGLIGTVFMGLSVFAYLAPMLMWSIIFAVPALAGWALSYVAYRMISSRSAAKVAPLIDSQQERIHGVCRKANDILHVAAA